MQDRDKYLELSVILWKSFPPVLLMLGSAGNLLAILVLMQRKNRQSTSALYLTALAVVDLLVLWTGLLRQWIKYTFNIDPRNMFLFGCKFHVFLVYVVFQCSSWFLVAFTSERFLAVLFPHKVKKICSRKNAVITLIGITAFLLLLNSHLLYGLTLRSKSSDNDTYHVICHVIDDDFYHAFYHQWKWIDISIHSFIPSTILSVANISIMLRILLRKYKRRTQIAPTAVTKEGMSQLTVMLVTTSTVFIVCTTPISIFLIACDTEKYRPDQSIRVLWWVVVNMLAYLNNTVNFVLYFLSGSKFRQQTKDLFFINCGNETH